MPWCGRILLTPHCECHRADPRSERFLSYVITITMTYDHSSRDIFVDNRDRSPRRLRVLRGSRRRPVPAANLNTYENFCQQLTSNNTMVSRHLSALNLTLSCYFFFIILIKINVLLFHLTHFVSWSLSAATNTTATDFRQVYEKQIVF